MVAEIFYPPLGFGNAATKNVGTTPGTVADGGAVSAAQAAAVALAAADATAKAAAAQAAAITAAAADATAKTVGKANTSDLLGVAQDTLTALGGKLDKTANLGPQQVTPTGWIAGTLADALAAIPSVPFARAGISTRTISLITFTVAGFAVPGDAGGGAPYRRGSSTGPMAIQDAAGTWFELDLRCGYCDLRWCGGIPDWSGSGAGSTDNTAAFRVALATGVPFIAAGLSYYIASPCEVSNRDVIIIPGGTIWYGGGASGVASGAVTLQQGASPLVLAGSALAKLGLSAGTYTGSVSGSTLGIAATYTHPHTQTAVAAGAVTAMTPLNAMPSPFVAGDTLVINGSTITAVASGVSGDFQIGVADPLWLLIDKIDSISGGGTFLRIRQGTGYEGKVVRIGAEGAALNINPCNPSGPSGRVLDISYPNIGSSTACQVRAYLNVSGSSAGTAPYAATFKSFAKLSGVWAPRINSNVFLLPIARDDGSYAFHLAGGSYGSVGAVLDGLYYYPQYGIVISGYVEALKGSVSFEAVGAQVGMYNFPSIAGGGAGGSYMGESWWLGRMHFNTRQRGIQLNYVQHIFEKLNVYNLLGPSNTGWRGADLFHCDRADMGLQAGGGAGIGAYLNACTESAVDVFAESMTYPYYLEPTCVNCEIRGKAAGSGAGNSVNNSTSSSVIFENNGNVTIGGTQFTIVNGPMRLAGYAFASLPSATNYDGCTVRVADRTNRLVTASGGSWYWSGTTTVAT